MEEAKVAPSGKSRRKCMGKLQTLECHTLGSICDPILGNRSKSHIRQNQTNTTSI